MKYLLSIIGLCIFTGGIISSSVARYPIVWIVAKEEPRDFATIQAALNNTQLLPGDDIAIGAGDYNENVQITNKSQIDMYAIEFGSKITGKITVTGLSNDILIKDLVIYQIDLFRGNNIIISNCYLKSTNVLNWPLRIYSVDGEIHATIKDCYINMDGTRIPNGAYTATASNNYIEVHYENNTFENCQYGVVADWNYTDTRVIDIYMVANQFISCDYDHASYSPYVNWHWKDCLSCPTWYKTPNYPSNYPNNCNESAVLDAPGSDGYYVVVNGRTESGYDKLYIREMNGTLIATVSGTKTNYKKWISTNRSVKVQFTSDGSVTYQGYMVTVED